MPKEIISKLIESAIKSLEEKGDFEIENISLEHPENMEHGDYSSNIAMVLAKQAKKNPLELAQSIADKIEKTEEIEKVEAVAPGFINFTLSKEFLASELEKISKEGDKYGKNDSLKGKKIMVEFTDPNPFKEFHIGHLYSNIVGESLAKLFESAGATVQRVNYQGDVGMHVAKAIWGILQKKEEFDALDSKEIRERVEFMGQAYAAGATAFEQNEEVKKEIAELNDKIFAADASVKDVYEKGRTWSLEYFEEIYSRLGTKFDNYYFESEVGKIGQSLVEEGLKKGIFEKSKGAIIFPGEKYGFHSRVFINSKGLPTYEAKELGLAPTKYKDFKYDTSVIVTGSEIVEYFKVLIAALKEINPEIGEKTQHVAHGMVRIPEGKMSSRTGNVLTGEELLDAVKETAVKRMESSDLKDKEDVAEAVSLAAVKHSLLKVSLGKDIVFDIEKSLSVEGNSGPYLQYTYVRCASIMREAGEITSSVKYSEFSKEERMLLRLLYRFPEVVIEATGKLSPHIISTYAFDLAQSYNNFYHTNPVLQAEKEEQKQFRLLLTSSVAQVLGTSMTLLGIRSLERM